METFWGILRSRAPEWLAKDRLVCARGWIVAAAVAAMAGGGIPWRAEAAGRVAVVIVGEEYQKLQKSIVSARQANAIAEALRAKGFDVLVGANPTNARARAILLDFARKANDADLAIAFVMGHATAAGGLSFFLPVNTELEASTDLFSRGVSISSVAQLAGRAKIGAVIVLMTTPNFDPAVPGLNARPEYAMENPRSVVTVFSTSDKVPMSRIDAVSAQAAETVASLLRQPSPSLSALVRAASADVGAVYGAPAEVSLAKPSPAPENVSTPVPQPLAKPAADVGANAQDGQKAHTEAERTAKEDAARAEIARLQLQQTRAELAKAKIEAQRAQAEASRATAEAEKAKAEAAAAIARTRAEARLPAQSAVPAGPVNENLLGKRQRQRIQERLRDMGLYAGPIDSAMSPLMREAIMAYQRRKGAKATGYLTPEQFQALVPDRE